MLMTKSPEAEGIEIIENRRKHRIDRGRHEGLEQYDRLDVMIQMNKAKQGECDERQKKKFLQGHDDMHKSRRPYIPEAEIQTQREVIEADGDHENGVNRKGPPRLGTPSM